MAKTLGGIYRFKCDTEACSSFERYAQEGETPPCPECGKASARLDLEPKSTAGFRQIQYSRSLGVNPDQIAEAKRKFPHHEFAPDGRMIFENAKQLDRVKKDLGFEHY
jgi:hypothetical protein